MKMTMNYYQQQALRTAREDWAQIDRLILAALGATGEAGEFADMIKKYAFHEHDLNQDKVIKELGDIMWYVSEAASAMGVTLESVALANIEKLQKRYPNGFDPERSKNRVEE